MISNIKDKINWLIKPENRLKGIIKNAIWEGDSSESFITLTFDDGPNPNITPFIIDCLSKHRYKAIFFMIGHKAIQYPEIVKLVKDSGNLIGYHTMNHTPLYFKSTKFIENDFKEFCKVVDSKIIYIRPPFGFFRNNLYTFAKENNLKIIFTNAYPRDKTIQNSNILLSRLKFLTKNGSIFLLHDGDKNVINFNFKNLKETLPTFLEFLDKNGFKTKNNL